MLFTYPRLPETLFVQQPCGRKDEWYVGKHIHHGQPVNGQLLLVWVTRQTLIIVSVKE